MTQIDEIVQSLLDADFEDTTSVAKVFERLVPQPIRRVHEEDEDDEETIKDILGPDYYDAKPPPTAPLHGNIERHGRWASVVAGNINFCISYLTPVAYHGPDGLRITDRNWSNTTANHISKWAFSIGLEGPGGRQHSFRDLIKLFPRVPQEDITKLFRERSAQVDWSREEIEQVTDYPTPTLGHKYVEPENKIDLRKWVPPTEEF